MSCLLCYGIVLTVLAFAIKLYIKLNTRWNNSLTCLNGKTAIVTGSNAGIGFETALDFAMRGARVILACRSKRKAEDAREQIVNATGNENVIVKVVDMQSFKSIREFCKDINETEDRLNILVNNAGGALLGNKRTEDGLQITMQTNHFGSFLLTHLLLDKLVKSKTSRIVNVSSYMAKYANVTADTLNIFPKGSSEVQIDNGLYANSKLCNLAFTVELARKLEGTGVHVFATHPGAVITDLSRNLPSWYKKMFYAVRSFFFWTAVEGAQCQIYCSVAKGIEMHHGQLFGNCRKIEMYEKARDPVFTKAVWVESEKCTKLSESEKL